jgi:hypothetical protein
MKRKTDLALSKPFALIDKPGKKVIFEVSDYQGNIPDTDKNIRQRLL